MKSVAVIGAGIAGISAAYYLARSGHNVTVIDQERYPAMQTSRANGGQISVSNSEVWNTWGNVGRGLKWMFKSDAPLLIRPGLSWHKATWLSQFLLATLRNDYAENTAKTIELGLKNRRFLAELIKQEDIQFNYNRCGIMHIYSDGQYLDNAITAEKIYNSNGCKWTVLDPDQAFKIEPTLKNYSRLIGATWTEDDSVGNMHEFCVQLSQVLQTRYNVKFSFNYKINHITDIKKNFDLVIVANGVDARRLARQSGDCINIYPVKGYSVTIEINEKQIDLCPKVSLLDDQAKIVTSTLGNTLRVAGTAELDGYNRDIRRSRIEPLLNWVNKTFPELDTRNYNQWACLRPMTPDMMPVAVPSKKDRQIWYHCGHGHLGWTLSLATANSLVDQITHG